MPRYLSCADTAKLVRQALRREFPAATFRVRSSVYAGGASITVKWVDGPTQGRVDAVVGEFAGATFDGMRDLKSSHVSDLHGEAVRFGADFVFTSRELSDKGWALVAGVVAREWGLEAVPPRSECHRVQVGGAYFGERVYRASNDRTNLAGN